MVPSVFVRTKLVCFMPVAADMLWFANAPYPYGSSPVHSICTQTRIHIVMFSFIVAITLPMVKWLSTTLLLSVTIKTAPAAPRGKLKSRTQIVTCMLMCDIGAVKEWGKNNSRKCQHFMILNSSLPNRTLHVSHSAKTNQIPPSLSQNEPNPSLTQPKRTKSLPHSAMHFHPQDRAHQRHNLHHVGHISAEQVRQHDRSGAVRVELQRWARLGIQIRWSAHEPICADFCVKRVQHVGAWMVCVRVGTRFSRLEFVCEETILRNITQHAVKWYKFIFMIFTKGCEISDVCQNIITSLWQHKHVNMFTKINMFTNNKYYTTHFSGIAINNHESIMIEITETRHGLPNKVQNIHWSIW